MKYSVFLSLFLPPFLSLPIIHECIRATEASIERASERAREARRVKEEQKKSLAEFMHRWLAGGGGLPLSRSLGHSILTERGFPGKDVTDIHGGVTPHPPTRPA